jgi:hypothetical protein
VRRVAFWAAVLAALPYLLLKVAWLAGSTIGLEDDTAIEVMRSPRFVIGNVITALMEVTAIALAFVLTRPWGRRIPAWTVAIVGGAATGLLAPILIGLPLGLLLQLASGLPPTAANEGGLAGWAFAFVYGGFGVLAAALAVLFATYAIARWPDLFSTGPRVPSRWVTVVGAIGLLPFGVAMVIWGAFGPGGLGPRSMDALDQRISLLVTGVLALAAFFAPLLRASSLSAVRAQWAVLWVGCACAALQGIAHLLLAEGGRFQPTVALLAVLATPCATVFGFSILRVARRRATADPGHPGDRRSRSS